MESDKRGEFISGLRKKNNLTQAQFGDLFGVTAQAVSKWENAINIPDILILKKICQEFNVNINEILDGERLKRRRDIKFYSISLGFIFLVFLLVWFLSIYPNGDEFRFKIISSDCGNFTIIGSMAYNTNQSHLYISRIEYCDSNEPVYFTKIECRLYKTIDNINTRLDSYTVQSESGIKLEDFLQDVRFHIDNFGATCLNEAQFSLQIFATDQEDRVISYTIPLTSSCPNNG